MRTIEIISRTLHLTERPIPIPKAHEVLIKVAAAGLNRADIFQVEGSYPPPAGASDLPGLEVSGVIAAVGSAVKAWQVGDKVCALLTGGGYAEYALAPAEQVLPIPAGLDFIQAAALPEAFFTVWLNLFDKGKLKKGDRLLVHAGASGIGTTAIMLARAFGIEVIATAGSSHKCAVCEGLGAVACINYYHEDVVQRVKEITGGKGVTMVLDMLGGEYMQKNLQCLAVGGRIVTIALLKGANAQLNLGALLLKNLTIMGSTLRAQPLSVKKKIARKLLRHVWPLLENNTIKPLIDKVFTLENATDAHNYMKSNQHSGKIILTVTSCGN
jgi:NADPH:quinone reductase